MADRTRLLLPNGESIEYDGGLPRVGETIALQVARGTLLEVTYRVEAVQRKLVRTVSSVNYPYDALCETVTVTLEEIRQ